MIKSHTELTELTEREASKGHVSVRSVVPVWGDKKSHGTHGNGGAEVNVSVFSVVSVWDNKNAHGTHGKG